MFSKSLKLIWAVTAPLSNYPLPKVWGVGVLRWILHFLMVFIIVGLSEFFQIKSNFSRFVRAPFPLLREYWLPIFVVFLYLEIWLVWAFLYSLKLKGRYFPFKEIQSKFEFGINYAESRGIDLKTTPIFLMLGQSISGSNHLLKIYSQSIQNFNWNESILLPSNEGVFINIEQNSHLGSLEFAFSNNLEKPLKMFTLSNDQTRKEPELNIQTKIEMKLKDPVNTKPDKSDLSFPEQDVAKNAVQEALQAAQSEIAKVFSGSPPIEMPFSIPDTSGLSQSPEVNSEQRDDLIKHSPKNIADNSNIPQKLNFLMEKIEELRFPVCPINGIAVVIPIPYLTSGNIAEILNACQKDLIFIREKFELNFPVHIFYTDIDKLPGYSSFLANNIPSKINESFGVNFQSCLANLSSEEVQTKIKNGISWVLTEWFPKTIYSFLDFSKSGRVSNLGFLELMSSFWKMETLITQFSAKLVAPSNMKPFLVGGCHFMATGADIENQAFYEKAFSKMIEMQNCVSWRQKVFSKDRLLLLVTVIGYSFIVAILLLALYLTWSIILK